MSINPDTGFEDTGYTTPYDAPPSSSVIGKGAPSGQMTLEQVLAGLGLSTDPNFVSWLQKNGYADQLTKNAFTTNAPTTDLKALKDQAGSWYQQYQTSLNPGTDHGGPAPGPAAPPAVDPRFAPINPPPFAAPTPAPLPTAPTYTPPARPQAPAFDYKAFVAPSYEEARNDPGYQFGEKQGEDALSRHYAAMGLGDSSTFYKGLIDYGRSAADTQYGDVFNRSLTSYGANRANAVDIYNSNYQTQFKDPWTADFEASKAQFAPKQVGYTTEAANTQFNNTTSNTNAWNSYLQDYFVKHANQLDDWNRLFGLASLQ